VLSLGRWIGGGLGAVAVIVIVVLLLVGGGDDEQKAASTPRPTNTSSASPAPTVTGSARPTDQVTVAVFNANGRSGLARTVSNALTDDGYDIQEVGDAARTGRTAIYYQAGAKADAEALLEAHPEFQEIRELGPRQPQDFTLVLVLGTDYKTS
jgi:hypothetical protein